MKSEGEVRLLNSSTEIQISEAVYACDLEEGRTSIKGKNDCHVLTYGRKGKGWKGGDHFSILKFFILFLFLFLPRSMENNLGIYHKSYYIAWPHREPNVGRSGSG